MMNIVHPFLFYFPLKIVLVDDDTNFLEVTKTNLTAFETHSFESSNQALLKIDPIEIKLKDFIQQQVSEEFHLNYESIEDFIEVCQDKHGIIIADFDMSTKKNNIDGISLLSNFQTTNIIRVLLTNVYTVDKAVEALNREVISYYLAKDKIESIYQVVNNLHIKFFYSMTKDILNMLEKNSLEFITDKDYIEIFNNIISLHQISKYRILNSYGAYYLENYKERFILTIFSKDDLVDITKEVSVANKSNILSGKQIPSYFSDNLDNSCKLIDAKNHGKYYYAIEKYEN